MNILLCLIYNETKTPYQHIENEAKNIQPISIKQMKSLSKYAQTHR